MFFARHMSQRPTFGMLKSGAKFHSARSVQLKSAWFVDLLVGAALGMEQAICALLRLYANGVLERTEKAVQVEAGKDVPV